MSGIQNPKALGYQTVAASQTNAKLGATGGAGDYLDKLIVTVSTAASGTVSLTDGQTSTLNKDLPYILDAVDGMVAIGAVYFYSADLTNWPTSGYVSFTGYNALEEGPYTNIAHYTSVAYDAEYAGWYITVDQVGCFGSSQEALSGSFTVSCMGLTAELTSVTNLPPQGIIGVTTSSVTEYMEYISIAGNKLLIKNRGVNGSTVAAHVVTNATTFGNPTITITAANTPIGVYTVPLTTQCVSNAWRVTTGAGASVVAVGTFTR